MTKNEIFLYRQNMLNDLKHFLSIFSFSPTEAIRWLPIYEMDSCWLCIYFSVYHNPARSIMHAHDKLKQLFRISGCVLTGSWAMTVQLKYLYLK